MCTVKTGRVSFKGEHGLDITVKSGAGLGKLLAPTWDLVLGVKGGTISEEEYTRVYLALLRERYRGRKEQFLEVLRRDEVVLLCYCRKGWFCHRHIAVEVLEKIARAEGIAFARGGEVA